MKTHSSGITRREAIASSLGLFGGTAWAGAPQGQSIESKGRFDTIYHFAADAMPSTHPLLIRRKHASLMQLVGMAGQTMYHLNYSGYNKYHGRATSRTPTTSHMIYPSPRDTKEDTFFPKVYGTETLGGNHGTGSVYWVPCANRRFFHDYFIFGAHDKLGLHPKGGVIEGFDAALYGCCADGGRYNAGTIFRIDTSGQASVMHDFVFSSGGLPTQAPTAGSDGHYYGATEGGGISGRGALYRLEADGAYEFLHSFDSEAEGWSPHGALVQSADGLLYGLCSAGGAAGLGTIFSLVHAGRFRHLFSFSGADGATPMGSLLALADGTLYGTCSAGGAFNQGVAFKFKPGHHRKIVVLHDFANNAEEGGRPMAALTLGSTGYLFSTTMLGGQSGGGTMFRLAP